MRPFEINEKERAEHVKFLQTKFPNFIVYSNIITSGPTVMVGDIEREVPYTEKYILAFVPKEKMASGEVEKLTGKDIPVGYLRITGNTFEEVKEKSLYLVELFSK